MHITFGIKPIFFSYKIHHFVDLASDLSATLLVSAGLPIVRFFSIRGSLIPQQAFVVGRAAIKSASRGDMVVQHWTV
jgi:hypothetical protein